MQNEALYTLHPCGERRVEKIEKNIVNSNELFGKIFFYLKLSRKYGNFSGAGTWAEPPSGFLDRVEELSA